MSRNPLYVLLGVSFLFLQSQRPVKQSDTERYRAEARTFIHWFRDTMELNRDLVLLDRPEGGSDPEIRELDNTPELSPIERETVKKQLRHPVFPAWTRYWAGPCKLLKADSLSLFLDQERYGWKYIHAHYADEFWRFSPPVFLQDYTLCVFYAAMRCEGLCGEGRFCIYKKINGRWTVLTTISHWVS